MPTLNWLDRNNSLKTAVKVPCRVLREVVDLSYGDKTSGNMLIEGDNLHALKALMPYYRGQVKCIFIDPPFNTQQAFEHYQDSLEHSQWLGMIYPRLELLRDLLSEDGSFFIHLNDDELDYCKVILDEIFGRKNFINRIVVEARSPSAFSTVNSGIFKASEYILWYAKNKTNFAEKNVRIARKPDYAYNKWIKNPEDSFQNWQIISLLEAYLATTQSKSKHPETRLQHFDEFIINNSSRICRFASISDSGAGEAIINLKKSSLIQPERIFKLQRTGGLDDIYILNGQQIIFYEKNVVDIDGKITSSAILTNVWKDIAWEGIANEGMVTFKKGKKPEKLVRRCVEITTNEGDLVLDSFLGSGTTAAVAHKMGRRYIGIEMGEHARSHCAARLKKVVDGEQGGISKVVNWVGGGGFRFYQLGGELFDKTGQINPQVRFCDLAAYIWFAETRTPWAGQADTAQQQTPLLGVHDETAYYLLYNGILKDNSPNGGNIITHAVLQNLPPYKGKRVIYANGVRLGEKAMMQANIIFKPIPWAMNTLGKNLGKVRK